MKYVELESPNSISKMYSRDDRPPKVDPETVLSELFELLEEYAPVWYQHDHHDRAVAALQGK